MINLVILFLWDFANIDSYTGGSDVNDISGNGDNGTIHNSPVNENGYIKLVGANSQYLINNNDLLAQNQMNPFVFSK